MKRLLLLFFVPLLFSCQQSSNKENPLKENVKKTENTESIENTLNLDLDVTIINESNKGLKVQQPKPKPKPNAQKPKPKLKK